MIGLLFASAKRTDCKFAVTAEQIYVWTLHLMLAMNADFDTQKRFF